MELLLEAQPPRASRRWVTQRRDPGETACNHSHRFRVIDSSRRLDKALARGLENVRAEVLPESTRRTETAALRPALTMVRSANPRQEAKAVQALWDAYFAEGVPEDEIVGSTARVFEISNRKICRRLKLLKLEPSLRRGVETEKVVTGAAGKIANLSPALQTQLAQKLETKDELTTHNVKAVQRVKQEATLVALLERLFAPLDTPLERDRHQELSR